MDQLIKDRYNGTILQEAMQRYGIAKDQIHSIDTFENFIYEFERDAHAYILRIAHSFRRSESLIQGEADWINFLAEGRVSVSRAIFSENGKLVVLASQLVSRHWRRNWQATQILQSTMAHGVSGDCPLLVYLMCKAKSYE